MNIDQLSNIFSSLSFPGIKDWVTKSPKQSCFKGLAGSSDSLLISDLFRKSNRPVFVLAENSKHAETLVEEIGSFVEKNDVLLYPSRDAIPYNMKSPFGPTVEARIRVLSTLLDGSKKIVVAPYTTLLQKIPHRRTLFNKIIRIKPMDELSITTLAEWLNESGFKRESQVSDIGTYSVRGCIVDIYPFLGENPLRIEFWGDSVDSIRDFDVFTQRSLQFRQSVNIFPMKEFSFSEKKAETAIESMLDFCDENNEDKMTVHKLEHQWKLIGDFEGAEWFFHWFDLPYGSILDYLTDNTIIVWNDVISLDRRLDEAKQNYQRHLDRVADIYRPFLSNPDKLLFASRQIEEEISLFDTIYIDSIDTPPDTTFFNVNILEQPQFQRDFNAINDNLSSYFKQNIRCILLSSNVGHAERIGEFFDENSANLEIATGFLQKGFIIKDCGFLIYTEAQIYNSQSQPKTTRAKSKKNSVPIASFDSLTPQDYVVHEDHGIARFLRVERIKAGETQNDCMVLLFADNSKVYVPVEDFYKVQKYVGKDSAAPVLSKIGTSSWEKLKTRTRESLKEMAQELIDLYAKRQFLNGIKFQEDNLWQKEFEDSFIYSETPDQLKAIKDVKTDMESTKPMDRLVCGDVGFGKTEVAMRAAFKAVMSGYQVAVLAPTTILAAQHFSTFCERMADFPVKISMLSRFLKGKNQKPIVQNLEEGKVDILIGTHRILSSDIKFKKLGLLIIDEEQRFGVNHKEKLKQLRNDIDVLSMTATPIPRSLHMSLIGARDLSIINTPPRNRLPIETKVAEYHDELVKSAIEHELDRGGQLYFVNNRIKNLDILQDKIAQLVPQARVISAHGQMDEKLLEIIMKEFIAGRYDILLSTVIIENGLDIPNVNTIIVNRSDTLGLSQLYQLRGRVGRSSEQAYAYFLIPSFKQINEISLRRLKALEQYTDLGSGFQIAMRDLEIRGAGNILGTRQHGFIAAVGFELYCRLLQEAVNEIKGEKPVSRKQEVKIEINIDAYISSEYISDNSTRISIYQELSSVSSIEEIDAIEKDLSDRFGPLPECVNSLLKLMKIKVLAGNAGCSRVAVNKNDELVMFFDGDQETVKNNIQNVFQNCKKIFEVQNDVPVSIRTKLLSKDKKDHVAEVLSVLNNLCTKESIHTN